MNIYLTYDYELYFGTTTGTVHDCLLSPTSQLLNIANSNNAKITLFVDAGFLYQLHAHISTYPQLKTEYDLIIQQLQQADNTGHAIQLHVHPHWEDSYYNGTQWIMQTNRYKLADFTTTEAQAIVIKYHAALQTCITTPITAFRAGGWCAQPFAHFSAALLQLNITTDSSVFVGGKNTISPYQYDYTLAPSTNSYNFDTDIIISTTQGTFTELPIAAYKYSPLFYWNLFVRGRLNPTQHKPIGNGKPIAQAGDKMKFLTKGMLFCACADGYYASKLPTLIKQHNNMQHFVIIGHPKAQTNYSLQATNALIKQYAHAHHFVAMR